jgi:hypothetical protein
MTYGHHRRMLANLLPGVALPGLIYLVVSHHASLIVALAAASAIPVLHAMFRLARRRRPSPIGLVFVAVTGVSIGLAVWLHSPRLMLAKGVVISAVVGVAFAVSAAIRRPLTRTLAIALSEDGREARAKLAERWANPRVLSVFRVLAVGWAILLLMQAAQQLTLILTVSPGLFVAVEPPSQAVVTVAGTALSILYVRRKQRLHADVRLLPVAAA